MDAWETLHVSCCSLWKGNFSIRTEVTIVKKGFKHQSAWFVLLWVGMFESQKKISFFPNTSLTAQLIFCALKQAHFPLLLFIKHWEEEKEKKNCSRDWKCLIWFMAMITWNRHPRKSHNTGHYCSLYSLIIGRGSGRMCVGMAKFHKLTSSALFSISFRMEFHWKSGFKYILWLSCQTFFQLHVQPFNQRSSFHGFCNIFTLPCINSIKLSHLQLLSKLFVRTEL